MFYFVWISVFWLVLNKEKLEEKNLFQNVCLFAYVFQ